MKQLAGVDLDAFLQDVAKVPGRVIGGSASADADR